MGIIQEVYLVHKNKAESHDCQRETNCNFCQKENETIEHIFWGCENVQNLLGQVNSWFGDKDIKQTFLKKTLIFGDVDKVYKDDVYNAILLNINYYIYTNRCLKKKLSFHSLKACLINSYKTEKNDCCPKSKNCRISITLEYFGKTV
jgi:hypothetical protein